jgi:hypothetical protein
MHIVQKAVFVILCATFSAYVQADDFISVVEQNFPYQEVDESYGAAKIQEGRCEEGTPFTITQEGFKSGTKMDVAEQIHARISSLGANAFVITELKEDTQVRSITVTPLTCDVR